LSVLHSLAAAVTALSLIGAAPGDPVRPEVVSLVRDHGFAGALAAVHDRHGHDRDLTAGASVPVNGRVRIGSNTKAFVAVVVLQLVAERKVELEAPVERYLPGLLPDRAVTVRQLLQHTSGLPEYTDYLNGEFDELRHRYYEPRELLDVALAHPALFAPGARWSYSNTNYVVAGLLVQRVTGRPIAEQLTDRVIRRAGLRDTYFPAIGDETIKGRHPHGYEGAVDVTEFDPSWAWAAGQLIATPRDLNTFFGALVDGKLLPPAQLKEMRATVEAPALWPGARYGLGLASFPLSCGGVFWGHGGDIPGYETRGGATEDGRAVAVAVTAVPTDEESAIAVMDVVDTAFCQG
jgi:D-alanyl-D-alanine carboxypeptidase